MMQILHSIPELSQLPGPLFLAIGVFDGVHRGHQAVISTSAEHARAGKGTPVVVTFDPHPEKILRPTNAPRLLTATEHKIALIRGLGVGHLLIINFDKQFAATEPEDFVRQLVEHSKPLREVCVGHEWSFGRNRRGNLALLKALGAQFGFEVVGIPPVKINGQVVSSTAIRRAVEAGDFAKAAEMLGRDYTVLGTVTHGDNLGKQIGFPTANRTAFMLPKHGWTPAYIVASLISVPARHSAVGNPSGSWKSTCSTLVRISTVRISRSGS
jgi:riboflavin kinase / FMN adenylyltransferase